MEYFIDEIIRESGKFLGVGAPTPSESCWKKCLVGQNPPEMHLEDIK